MLYRTKQNAIIARLSRHCEAFDNGCALSLHRSNLSNLRMQERLLRWLPFDLSIKPESRNDVRFDVGENVEGDIKRGNSSHSSPLTFHLSHNSFKSRARLLSLQQGFSLAEVLITLGIIGVVAAMTIPTLMNNIQDAQYKTAYKKAYSTLSQAVAAANGENLFEYASGQGDMASYHANFKVIMSKFKVTQSCVGTINAKCWDNSGEKFYKEEGGGYPIAGSVIYYSFIDASGMTWSEFYSGEPEFLVDTNGFKKPNQYGKDRFAFFSNLVGPPAKYKPIADNSSWACYGNKCGDSTSSDYKTYFGTSWLYQ